MSLSKAEARAAFREAAARSYAHVPPAESIDHVFSERFYRRMEALIEEQRRGSWRLLSYQRRRTLVIAAILAAALLLTACSPKLREAVTEFVVSVYERFVDYGASTNTREEIETIYVLDPVPEGFEFVSQTQQTDCFVETVYLDAEGVLLVLSQVVSENYSVTVDNENGETLLVEENGLKLLIHSSETLTLASWVFDGYYMNLSYYGQMDSSQLFLFTTTLTPIA